MKVYLVWSGYEDVDAVFANAEKAKEYVEQCLKDKHWKTRDSYSIIEEDVIA